MPNPRTVLTAAALALASTLLLGAEQPHATGSPALAPAEVRADRLLGAASRPDDLARPSTDSRRLAEWLAAEEDEGLTTAEAERAPAASGSVAPGVAAAVTGAGSEERSKGNGSPAPKLTFSSLYGNDPQVAVGKNFMVVTSYSQIAVYNRKGKLLAGRKGHPYTNPFYAVDLYRPIWNPASSHNINTRLNLPPNMRCDPRRDITNPADDAATKYCIDEYYDTRVVYDSYRKRFWIVSLARNANARNVDDPNILMGRRSFSVLAVTRTEDPRDGFYEFFWDGSVDQGACNMPNDQPCPGSAFHPGDAGDYPSIAVTDRYLVRTHNVANVISDTSRYGLVGVALADQLAAGSCNGCSWTFWNIKGTHNDVITGITPASHRSVSPLGLTFFAHDYGDDLLVLGLAGDPDHPNGQPAGFIRATVKLNRPFHGAIDARLPGTHDTMRLSNIGNYVLGLVYQDDKLYASFQDCTTFSDGPSSCSDGVRVVRVDVSNFLLVSLTGLPRTPASGFYDITFGLRTAGDPSNAVIQYGLPGLMVNKKGQVVTVYVRAGKSLYPEVRYAVLYPGETTFRASQRLHSGDFAATGNLDTAGIALDPADNLTIWMTHGYGDSGGGTHRLVVGKVKP